MGVSSLPVIAALAYGILAVWALWRAQVGLGQWGWRWLAVAASVSAVWAASTAELASSSEAITTSSLAWLDWVRQAAWMTWLGSLLGLRLSLRDRWGWMSISMVTVLAVTALALGLGGTPSTGSSRPLMAPLYGGLALSILGLVLLEQLYRNLGDDARWRIKPVCLGLAAMYGFDLYLHAEAILLRQPEPFVTALRPMAHALGVPLLVLSGSRGAALPQRIELSRDAAFHSAALLLAGGYLLLAAAVGYWLRFTGGAWGPALQLLLLAAAALVLVTVLASGAMRARLRVWLSKHFLRYRYDYRQEWLRFTAALTEEAHDGDASRAAIRALANLVESPAGGLWRLDGVAHVQVAQWHFERLAQREPPDSPFLAALEEKRWIVDLNAERQSPSGVVPIPEWLLADAGAWLVLPLVARGKLQAWVVLAQPRTPFPLNWEVLDLLRNASSQAAGYLALLQASSQLLEARKFEAFNRMSAFVVHDLKNIVSQLSLMLRNAERHGDNPEFRADMLETVDHAVEKMRQLMLQLREGDSPVGSGSGVELVPLLERLRAQASQRGRALNLDIEEPLATRGHAARMERVVGHAVQNAFDASPDGAPVTIRLSRWGSSARLEVRDEGCGMSEAFLRERLFRPFQSTKAHGMGIGAYESLQTVQELGGKIEVESEPGRGTTMTFLLPLLHTRTGET